jgi:hypothetical protein
MMTGERDWTQMRGKKGLDLRVFFLVRQYSRALSRSNNQTVGTHFHAVSHSGSYGPRSFIICFLTFLLASSGALHHEDFNRSGINTVHSFTVYLLVFYLDLLLSFFILFFKLLFYIVEFFFCIIKEQSNQIYWLKT